MVSSIVVGRVIVDPDHADVVRSLLSAEDMSVHREPIDSKEEDETTKADEEYARKIQDEFIQDTLRTMEDYRLAKSLAERDEESSFTFLDQPAMDYLRELLATREPLDHGPFVQKHEVPDRIQSEPRDDTAGHDSHLISQDHSTSTCEDRAAAAEQRRATLALAISAGFPGPSGIIKCPTSTEPSLKEWVQPVPSPVFSRSSSDPGDLDHIDIRYKRDDMDDINARDKRDHLNADEEKDEFNDAEKRDTRGVGDYHKDDADQTGDENRRGLLPP